MRYTRSYFSSSPSNLTFQSVFVLVCLRSTCKRQMVGISAALAGNVETFGKDTLLQSGRCFLEANLVSVVRSDFR